MPQQGMFAKAYYNTTTGAAGTGSYVELTGVRDVTLNLETGEADVTVRGNNGWRGIIGTLKEGSFEFEMVWEPADAGFAAVKDAWLNGTLLKFCFLDQSGASGEGPVADCSITNFSRSEPLEEAIIVNVTVRVSVFHEWTTTGLPTP